jgi:hypothetical protein
MQINFNSYPLEVRRENKYLHQALGSEHNKPRYQWAFSDDLMMPMVLLENGKQIYDYHCACGVNVSVHSADCQFSVPRARWEMRNLAYNMKSVWVLVKWTPPEAEKEDWEAVFGSMPYPEGGYYIPVSAKNHCVFIPGGDMPYRETSEMFVAAVRKHAQKTPKQHIDDIRAAWDKTSESTKEEWRQKFKDAFPVHEGFPGKKENWSAGGVGESPVLVTK